MKKKRLPGTAQPNPDSSMERIGSASVSPSPDKAEAESMKAASSKTDKKSKAAKDLAASNEATKKANQDPEAELKLKQQLIAELQQKQVELLYSRIRKYLMFCRRSRSERGKE
jgi:hypothetical protein